MKKFLLFGCIALALIFVSCKSTDKSSEAEEEQQETVEQTEETTEEQKKDALTLAEDAREQALKSGARDYYQDAFDAADKKLTELKNSDKTPSKAELADVTKQFEALKNASKAKKLKETIDSNNFASNDASSYQKGEDASKEFDELLASGASSTELLAKSTEMYGGYYSVYYTSYKKLANEERTFAVDAKKDADAIKAQIARKEEYAAYADMLKKGDTCYITKDPEGAYKNYQKAKENFAALALDVAEKREAAQKAIDEAKEKVRKANEYAQQADKIKPIGNDALDGIEEEDTVLLEEDEFADPEDEVIEVEDKDSLLERAGE